jgi:hypothetical protein
MRDILKEKHKGFAMSSRIKTSFKQEEPIPANIPADYQWLKANRDNLVEKYGTCLVVVYQQEVLATGETYAEAVANAEMSLPETPEIITPIIKPIGYGSLRLRQVRSNHRTKHEPH